MGLPSDGPAALRLSWRPRPARPLSGEDADQCSVAPAARQKGFRGRWRRGARHSGWAPPPAVAAPQPGSLRVFCVPVSSAEEAGELSGN